MEASFRLAGAAALFLALHPFAARGSVVPVSADASVSSTSPATNFGALPTLTVGGGAKALLRFDLSSLPAGTVSKATLTLFVNKVGTAGGLDLAPVTSLWGEATVTNATAPTTSAPFASNVPVTLAGTWVTVDVTSQVQGWVATPASNFGVVVTAAAASPSTAVFFDSKEAVATSHAATLDVAVTPGAVSLAYGFLYTATAQILAPATAVVLPNIGVLSGLVAIPTGVIFLGAGTYSVEYEVNAATSNTSFAVTLNGLLVNGSQITTAGGSPVSHTFLVTVNPADQLAVVNSDIVVVSVNSASLTIRQIQ